MGEVVSPQILVIVPVLVCLLAAPCSVWAGPNEDLRDAENSYLYGDYPRVIRKVTPLVEPDIRIPAERDLGRAYELLGLAHFFLDEKERSRIYFEKLIRMRPGANLDPVLVPPPAVAFFQAIKTELSDELERKREALRKAQLAEQKRLLNERTLLIEREIQSSSRLVSILPFGAGQFQNQDPLLGYALMTSQLAAIMASMTFFFSVENLRQDDGRFHPNDIELARDYQAVQISFAGVAIALMLGGAIEAWQSFKPKRTLREEQRPVLPSTRTGGAQGLTFSF